MSVQVQVLVRVVGTQAEPKVLTTLTLPAPLPSRSAESPFGPIPVNRLDLALALRAAADELEGLQS